MNFCNNFITIASCFQISNPFLLIIYYSFTVVSCFVNVKVMSYCIIYIIYTSLIIISYMNDYKNTYLSIINYIISIFYNSCWAQIISVVLSIIPICISVYIIYFTCSTHHIHGSFIQIVKTQWDELIIYKNEAYIVKREYKENNGKISIKSGINCTRNLKKNIFKTSKVLGKQDDTHLLKKQRNYL